MNVPIRFLSPDAVSAERRSAGERLFAHPFFAWIGIRPVQAQHTAAEHAALAKHAERRKSIVEIGVAEGASAVALAERMAPGGNLYLVDPFHLSKRPLLNFLRRVAHRAVARSSRGKVTWLERFSYEAGPQWSRPIDFLLIDGDHREEAVEEDWKIWSRHLLEDGIAAFHDARLFPSGWTTADDGPVRFVNRTFRSNEAGEWMILDEVDSLVFVGRRQRAVHSTSSATMEGQA